MDWLYGFFMTLLLPNILTLECGEFTSPNYILETRIVNGELAALGEFPWQVTLQRKVRVKLETSNVTDIIIDDNNQIHKGNSGDNANSEHGFIEIDEDDIQLNLLWQEILRMRNLTEEDLITWNTQSSSSSLFPPLPTFPPDHVFPPPAAAAPSFPDPPSQHPSSSPAPPPPVIIEHNPPPVVIQPNPPLPPPVVVQPNPPLPPPVVIQPNPPLPPPVVVQPNPPLPPPGIHPNPQESQPRPTMPPIISPPKPPSTTTTTPPIIVIQPNPIPGLPPIVERPKPSLSPPIIILPKPSMPPIVFPPMTPPKHWTKWPTSNPWSTMPTSMPTISKFPTWSTPKIPIILPIPTAAPRPKPGPPAKIQPTPQPQPQPKPQPQPQPKPRPKPMPPRPDPSQAYWKWQHFCGGSIINNNWILTAAHCVESMRNTYTPGMIQILAGSTNWRKPDNQYAQAIEVDRIVVHEAWRQNTGQNDIALLHLSKPLSYVKQDKIYVNNVCLSTQTQQEYQGVVSSSGWGFVSKDNRVTPELLRRVDLVVVDHPTCRHAFSRVIEVTQNQVCAGRSPKGNCMGDSGGPLIQKHGNKATQIGIVSFSIPCAVPGYPDVFTRVSKYIGWISSKTGLNFIGVK